MHDAQWRYCSKLIGFWSPGFKSLNCGSVQQTHTQQGNSFSPNSYHEKRIDVVGAFRVFFQLRTATVLFAAVFKRFWMSSKPHISQTLKSCGPVPSHLFSFNLQQPHSWPTSFSTHFGCQAQKPISHTVSSSASQRSHIRSQISNDL